MPTVLIVNDSLTVRMDLVEAFESVGFRCLGCGTVREATEFLGREAIDVAVLDVMLPDGDGIELLERVRGGAAARRIVVLMLSSEAEVRDRLRGLATGADEYVGKPYEASYVVARAQELMGGAEAASEQPLVLLVDDSATFRTAFGRALVEGGFRLVTASSGEEGLRIAAARAPNAIVVDGVLPGMDGPTLIRRVRLDGALRGVPCLLLSGSQGPEHELAALDSGADAFVSKTDDARVILAKLRALLRASTEARDAPRTRSLAGPRRVLVVDDSATFRETMAEALRLEGYDVVQVASGEEALELVAVQPVDCVLLDLVMPGLGGTETCRRLKLAVPSRDIPVLVLTAVEDRSVVLEVLGAGADDFIQKSSELDVLKARVRAQLRRRQFEDETRRVREQLLRSEIDAAEARAAHKAAVSRMAFLERLAEKNRELDQAYKDLQAAQAQLVQAAKMASLGGLVAGIAHEINNPLAFSLSHLSTAERDLDGLAALVLGALGDAERPAWERAHTRLREMRIGLERIGQLVLKLRTFSRLDEGALERVDIVESVDSVLTILQHRLRDRINVVRRFDAPRKLDCYPGPLNQAIMNLVANSIDAIAGQGTITISTDVQGDRYCIAVADTGSGILPEHREQVFDPFFTTKPVGQGTGLGLSITYAIVRQHGGELVVSQPSTGGTTMTMRLPLSQEGAA